ncbi:exported hypothetical protein [Paraburkholderia piptadeniae]|uniref:Uncharacterized protein n=1 Tax=Paraburkholderia piptadeniae TaxID=1701573 RepID=A0A1N7RM18_9BURK|nr:exported hypothetical protein [Paraburkholderia piptadeniae]
MLKACTVAILAASFASVSKGMWAAPHNVHRMHGLSAGSAMLADERSSAEPSSYVGMGGWGKSLLAATRRDGANLQCVAARRAWLAGSARGQNGRSRIRP